MTPFGWTIRLHERILLRRVGEKTEADSRLRCTFPEIWSGISRCMRRTDFANSTKSMHPPALTWPNSVIVSGKLYALGVDQARIGVVLRAEGCFGGSFRAHLTPTQTANRSSHSRPTMTFPTSRTTIRLQPVARKLNERSSLDSPSTPTHNCGQYQIHQRSQ